MIPCPLRSIDPAACVAKCVQLNLRSKMKAPIGLVLCFVGCLAAVCSAADLRGLPFLSSTDIIWTNPDWNLLPILLAPEQFQVLFNTTKGPVTVQVVRSTFCLLPFLVIFYPRIPVKIHLYTTLYLLLILFFQYHCRLGSSRSWSFLHARPEELLQQ